MVVHARFRNIFLTSAFLFLLFLFFLTSSSNHQPRVNPGDPSQLDPHYLLHLILPAEETNTHLCRNLLSTALLGYPTPVLVNWNSANQKKTARIPRILEYLQRIKVSEEGDLVLIADAFEHWFQLSPHILISRYHELNKWANDNMAEKLGDNRKAARMRQTIAFNSHRKCWPFIDSDRTCTQGANSPFPKIMYEKDVEVDSEATERETFLDANFIMGPVEGMRLLFERAKAKLDARGDTEIEDEEIFTEIWGEQEVMRQPILEPSLNASSAQILQHDFNSESGVRYELGIGIDYTNVIFPPKIRSSEQFPLDFLVFGNKTLVNQTYKAHSVALPEPLPTLHADIASDNLPFAPLSGSVSYSNPEQGYLGPSSTKWEHVSLYTDLWTGITPAIIPQDSSTLSPAASHSTDHEDTHHEIWFTPLTRKLLGAVLQMHQGPVAEEGKTGHGRKWFSPVSRDKFREKGGFGVVMDGKGGGLYGWNEVCDEQAQQEAFGDGKGPWKLGEGDAERAQETDSGIIAGSEPEAVAEAEAEAQTGASNQ